MSLYIKTRRNKRHNFTQIILTETTKPLKIIEVIGSIQVTELNHVIYVKININRLKFWLRAGARYSQKIVKILVDLNFLPSFKTYLTKKKF